MMNKVVLPQLLDSFRNLQLQWIYPAHVAFRLIHTVHVQEMADLISICILSSLRLRSLILWHRETSSWTNRKFCSCRELKNNWLFLLLATQIWCTSSRRCSILFLHEHNKKSCLFHQLQQGVEDNEYCLQHSYDVLPVRDVKY